MSKVKFRFEKLVRDFVPQEMMKDNIELYYEILAQNERFKHLKDKLIEEIQELLEAQSRDEIISEIADVYDVMKALYGDQITLASLNPRGIAFLRDQLCNVAIAVINGKIDYDELYKILSCISLYYEISEEEISASSSIKYKKRGGFELGIYARYIEIDSTSNPHAVEYFRSSPQKYPIIL